jgi:hypothetical protein
MTHFGNLNRLDLASSESSLARASLLPGNFGSELGLSASSNRALSSLKQETDPELLAAGLLNWAGREEQEHRPASANLAYQFLSENSASLGLSADVQQKVQDRTALLAGGGSVGARVEYQLSRFVQEAGNPAFIGAMATGSAIFTYSRSVILARLAGSGSTILGARALSTAGAFALEVPSVWASAKGITELMAPGSQNWSAEQNLRELAGLGLTLGALKFSAGVAGRAAGLPATGAFAANPSVARNTLVHASAIGGIAIGRQLEVAAGLRAPTDGASLAIDSLALFMQTQVGGRLVQSGLSPRFQARSRALETSAREGEAHTWSRLTESWRPGSQFALFPGIRPLRGQSPDMIGQSPDMIGQGPDMIGQGPDMIRPGSSPFFARFSGSSRLLRGQSPDMIGQSPDMIGQSPDMIGQGPDMIRPAFGQGPDMRTALN